MGMWPGSGHCAQARGGFCKRSAPGRGLGPTGDDAARTYSQASGRWHQIKWTKLSVKLDGGVGIKSGQQGVMWLPCRPSFWF
uniref:Uncharacterized protein n=1 Tax=Xanthomonas campestris pv. campestris TaxID=340 RepID=A0A0C7KNH9_XANCE|nr:hypothetical protein pXCCB1459_0057 [Xanthomonas campestris pv. campestris]